MAGAANLDIQAFAGTLDSILDASRGLGAHPSLQRESNLRVVGVLVDLLTTPRYDVAATLAPKVVEEATSAAALGREIVVSPAGQHDGVVVVSRASRNVASVGSNSAGKRSRLNLPNNLDGAGEGWGEEGKAKSQRESVEDHFDGW